MLPGTYYDADEGRRVPLYFSRNRHVNHIELLHGIPEQNMVALMERYVGPDWEHRYDALHPEGEQPLAIEPKSEPDIGRFDWSLDL